MSRLNKLTSDNDNFDCRERVEVWFNPSSFDPDGSPSYEGEWQWQYTLETPGGSFISRRLGTTGLNNRNIRVDHLHRALCHDRSLGIYVPKTQTWFNPIENNTASGWAFVQRQHRERAKAIEHKVQAFLDSQTS